jgi:tryptophan-rich sensory protein
MKKHKSQYIISLTIGISISLAIGWLSSMVTQSAINDWYANLEKPFFSPPN